MGLTHASVALHCHGLFLWGVAIIIFEEIDSPPSPELCILFLKTITARVPRAGLLGGIRIDTEFESLFVNVIGQRFHPARKFLRVSDQIAVAIPFVFDRPAIIDDDIVVPIILEPA